MARRKLNADGVPTEIPSIQRKKSTTLFDGIDPSSRQASKGDDSGDAPTMLTNSVEESAIFPDDLPTRPGGVPPMPAPGVEVPEVGEPPTQIADGIPRKSSEEAAAPGPTNQGQQGEDPSQDPVVGWLVVVKGPGMGVSTRLGIGQNRVGRGENVRVRINLGDNQISRSDQMSIAYDPKSNKFHIHPGTGLNLTYLNDEPVLGSSPLVDRSEITIGETTLRFVALCGDDFSWSNRDRDEERIPSAD